MSRASYLNAMREEQEPIEIEVFNAAWREREAESQVDAFGGAEYQRALDAWLTACRTPGFIDAMIALANIHIDIGRGRPSPVMGFALGSNEAGDPRFPNPPADAETK